MGISWEGRGFTVIFKAVQAIKQSPEESCPLSTRVNIKVNHLQSYYTQTEANGLLHLGYTSTLNGGTGVLLTVPLSDLLRMVPVTAMAFSAASIPGIEHCFSFIWCLGFGLLVWSSLV